MECQLGGPLPEVKMPNPVVELTAVQLHRTYAYMYAISSYFYLFSSIKYYMVLSADMAFVLRK
jgi:hypothetical protein